MEDAFVDLGLLAGGRVEQANVRDVVDLPGQPMGAIVDVVLYLAVEEFVADPGFIELVVDVGESLFSGEGRELIAHGDAVEQIEILDPCR